MRSAFCISDCIILVEPRYYNHTWHTLHLGTVNLGRFIYKESRSKIVFGMNIGYHKIVFIRLVRIVESNNGKCKFSDLNCDRKIILLK